MKERMITDISAALGIAPAEAAVHSNFQHLYARNFSLAEIGRAATCSPSFVRDCLLGAGVQMRGRGGPNNPEGKNQFTERHYDL